MAGASLPPPKRVFFQQSSAASVWSITHNFGYFPNVIVSDAAGNVVDCDVQHTSANTVVLSFGAAFAGAASLS